MAIHHTGLTVSNLERALAFWCDALGMQVVMQQDRQGGYFEEIVGEHGVDVRTAQIAFGGEGPRIELFEFRSPRGGRVALRTADVGFSHVCVTCDDIDALLERLVAAGGDGGVRARRPSTPAPTRAVAASTCAIPTGTCSSCSRRRRPDDALRSHRHRLDAVRRSARAAAADPPAPHRDPDRRVPHGSAPLPTR